MTFNDCTFDDDSGYYMILDFGRKGGYMKCFSFQIKRLSYQGMKWFLIELVLILKRPYISLEYIRAITCVLKNRFEDKEIASAFKIIFI